MPETENDSQYQGQYFTDINTRIRDVEEKQRLLKDRTMIMGKNFIEERDSTFKEIQELKKSLLEIKQENIKIKQTINNITEHLENTARIEDLNIIKRQLDILRK